MEDLKFVVAVRKSFSKLMTQMGLSSKSFQENRIFFYKPSFTGLSFLFIYTSDKKVHVFIEYITFIAKGHAFTLEEYLRHKNIEADYILPYATEENIKEVVREMYNRISVYLIDISTLSQKEIFDVKTSVKLLPHLLSNEKYKAQ